MDVTGFRHSENVEDLRDSSYPAWAARQLAGPFVAAYEDVMRGPFTSPNDIPPSAYTNPLAQQAGFNDIDAFAKANVTPPEPMDDKTALMIKALQQGF
jgi:hypothetical protein